MLNGVYEASLAVRCPNLVISGVHYTELIAWNKTRGESMSGDLLDRRKCSSFGWRVARGSVFTLAQNAAGEFVSPGESVAPVDAASPRPCAHQVPSSPNWVGDGETGCSRRCVLARYASP